jgi:hypothetical protein
MKPTIEVVIPDKYFKNPTEEPIIGLIRYLKEQGKVCEFLGFNEASSKSLGITIWHNNYVVIIDGIKYYIRMGGSIDTNYYAALFVVNDEEQDYIENLLSSRVKHILDILEKMES